MAAAVAGAGAGTGTGVAATADPSARVVVSSALRSACNAWHGEEAVFACDPRGKGRRITLTLGQERVSRRSQHRAIGGGGLVDGASLKIGGDEPLHPGEAVALDWPTPSTEAELAIKAFTPYGVRTVVLRLSWRPRHVDVTVRSDGGLEVRSPGRTEVVPAPGPASPESWFWQPRSAQDAADRLLWVIDHLADRGLRGQVMHTLCAGLHPDVYAFYGRALQLRGIDDRPFLELSCSEEMSSFVFGSEVQLRSSRHRGRALHVRGGRAVLRTSIVHRYEEDAPGAGSRRVVIPARVLLTKDREGRWRLASFRAIFADSMTHDSERERYDDRALESWYQHQRRRGARHQASYDRWQAARRAAQTLAGDVPPCAPGWHADRGGDVEAGGMDLRITRRPLEHLDVDLAAAGFDGQCLGVRTAGPLPSEFEVGVNVGEDEAGDSIEYHVSVDRGQRTVLATRGTFSDGTVPGIQASLSDDELVVRFPRPVPGYRGPVYLGIQAFPLGIRFSDGLTLG